jgi:hypothetical protein
MNLGLADATFFEFRRRPVGTGTSPRSQGLVLVDFSSTTFICVSGAGFPRIWRDNFADFCLATSANHFLEQHDNNRGYKRCVVQQIVEKKQTQIRNKPIIKGEDAI